MKIYFIIIVILHHSSYVAGYLIKGYIGVEFFFMVSGYFLCQYSEKNPNNTTFEFLKRRVKKLYPYYIVSYVVMFVAMLVFYGEVYNNYIKGLWEILLVQNIGIPNSGGINYPL